MTWLRRMLDCVVMMGVLICASPLSAQSVQQSGVITPTHFACWTTGGVIQDCGVAAQPFASTGGVSPGPWCVNSGPVTGPYQSFCLNVSPTTGGILSIQNFGGAPAGGINFNINGSPAGLPVVITPTTSGDAACFNNTSGTLIDCGTTIQTPIDIFLVIGDSNAVGQGSSGSSPPVQSGLALAYCANGTIVAANDPTCSAVNAAQNANTGSAWPAVANAYGRRIGFVLTGVSGSTQASAADFHLGGGNWQDTGTGSNNANALAAINAALTAYSTAGYGPVFRGIIYVLGNNDAAQIDNSVITVGQYTSALTAFVSYWRSVSIGGTVYSNMPIFMPIIGTSTNQSDTGYQAVRGAQQTFAAIATNDVFVPYVDMLSLLARGLLNSGPHPTQAGYNSMGAAIGASLIPQVPALIPFLQLNANAANMGVGPVTGTVLQIIGTDSQQASILVDSYGTTGNITFREAAGTAAAPTATNSGSLIGIFAARGYGTTGFFNNNSGALIFSATQNFSDTAFGTKACIYTTANSTTSPICNLQVDQNGAVTLVGNLITNVTGSTQCLHVNSSGVVSGSGSDCSAATPGGLNTQVQFNNSGSFGGISGVTSNGTSITIASSDLILSGASSGSSTVNAPSTGGGTATLFAGSSTIAGLAVTQEFTAPNDWNVASTIVSATSAKLDDLFVKAATTTVTGTTAITTAAGFNKVSLYQPTITDASAVTITSASTLYVDNAPTCTGSATCSSVFALRTGAGVTIHSGANETQTVTDGLGSGNNTTFAVQRKVTSLNSNAYAAFFEVQMNNTTASQTAQGVVTELDVPSGNSTAMTALIASSFVSSYAGTGGLTLNLGQNNIVLNTGTGTVTSATNVQTVTQNTGGGTITTADGILITTPAGPTTALTSTWTNINGIEIKNQNPTSSGGGSNTITNAPIALLIDSQTASGAFAISQVGSGIVQFATANVKLTGVTTGTNADFLCLSASGVVLIQSSACTISSRRFKSDWVTYRGNALALLDKMEIGTFHIDMPNRDPNAHNLQVGLSAESVAKASRLAAVYEDDGVTPKSYRQEAVLALVVGAIHQLKADNDNLRRELTALKRKTK